MRCITLHQPWATLAVTGQRQYELRSWQPDLGWLAIHAAVRACDDLPAGCIIGAIKIINIISSYDIGNNDLAIMHGYDNASDPELSPGMLDDIRQRNKYAWVIDEAIALPADMYHYCSGKRKIWHIYDNCDKNLIALSAEML